MSLGHAVDMRVEGHVLVCIKVSQGSGKSLCVEQVLLLVQESSQLTQMSFCKDRSTGQMFAKTLAWPITPHPF